VAPSRFLRFEVPDPVRLRVPDAGFFHGGFPADALLACRFDLVLASGAASPRSVNSWAGGVGPFARPVRLAAAEDETEPFGQVYSKRGILTQESFLAAASSFSVATW
jgi:hypothetical protein